MTRTIFKGMALACFVLLLSCGENTAKTRDTGAGDFSEQSREGEATGEKKLSAGEGNLPIGYGLAIGNFKLDTLKYSASVGVAHLEASGMGLFVDRGREFKMSEDEIIEILTQAKKDAEDAGINIWSIHMPFGERIDLSMVNEQERREVVAMHIKLLQYLQILEPEVILFHPSYYLGLNERETRKTQLIKSAKELDKAVQQMGAIMVLENMLGPELLVDETRERPLMRSVEESVEIFGNLPTSIGLAVDTNHILHAEELIRALGDRLKSLHIADGTGKAENHWFPCDNKGVNDWNRILAALDAVDYDGPFMYESKPEDPRDFLGCYKQLVKLYKESHAETKQ